MQRGRLVRALFWLALDKRVGPRGLRLRLDRFARVLPLRRAAQRQARRLRGSMWIRCGRNRSRLKNIGRSVPSAVSLSIPAITYGLFTGPKR